MGNIYKKIVKGNDDFFEQLKHTGYYDVNAGITQLIGDNHKIDVRFYRGDDNEIHMIRQKKAQMEAAGYQSYGSDI